MASKSMAVQLFGCSIIWLFNPLPFNPQLLNPLHADRVVCLLS
jgi:hypothetical protein